MELIITGEICLLLSKVQLIYKYNVQLVILSDVLSITEAPTSVLTVNVTDVRPDRIALNVTESEKKDDLEITGYRVVINGIAHEFVTGILIYSLYWFA